MSNFGLGQFNINIVLKSNTGLSHVRGLLPFLPISLFEKHLYLIRGFMMAQACKIFLSLTLEAEAGGVQGQFNWSTEGVPRQQGRHNPSLEKKQNTLKKKLLTIH